MNAESDDAYLRSTAGSPGLTARQIAALRALDHGALSAAHVGANDGLLDDVPAVLRNRLLTIFEPPVAEAWLRGTDGDGVRPIDLLLHGETGRFEERLAAAEQIANGA